MKKIAVAFLLLFATFAWAAADPNPAGYTTNVHVSSSRLVVEVPNGVALDYQVLNVVINGKKYELMSSSVKNVLLALGDYKAKLVQDEHKTAYDSLRVYEFLFADKKTRKFEVVGQTE
jgi:hypothetical protein